MNRPQWHGAATAVGTSEAGAVAISIGMPVYNGEATIGTAIAAVLAQSFTDFELIISDNASTDGTLAICHAAAVTDQRIRIIEQPRNLGAHANFETVLNAARAPFFAFAAADDWMEPGFIEDTLAVLQGEPGAVACAPRTLVHFSDGRCREAYGTRAIRGPAWWRLFRFFVRPADNSRFYGLYRTGILRSCYLGGQRFHALDWAISALTLAKGEHLRSHSVILHRQGAEPDKYFSSLRSEGVNKLDRRFPIARMSAVVLARVGRIQAALIFPVLLTLNLQKFLESFWSSARFRWRG